jgi:hypothetical protein
MIPSIPLVVVTSLAEVFFEGMEYDDTFHTFSRCDLIVINISYSEITMRIGLKDVIVLHLLNKYFIQ